MDMGGEGSCISAMLMLPQTAVWFISGDMEDATLGLEESIRHGSTAGRF